MRPCRDRAHQRRNPVGHKGATRHSMASFQPPTHCGLAAERNLRCCGGRPHPSEGLSGGGTASRSLLFALVAVVGCVSVASGLYCERQCACSDNLPYYHNTSSSTGCCLGWFGQCLTCCNEPNPADFYLHDSYYQLPPAGNRTCDGYSGTWTSPTGYFTDGSSTDGYYGRNQSCWWYIEPGYNYIHLEFRRFDTEHGYDYVSVLYLDSRTGYLDHLATFSGTALPGDYYVSSGNSSTLAVQFTSDHMVSRSGFAAYYTYTSASTGWGLPWHTGSTPRPRDCPAFTELYDATGVISDGSEPSELYVSDGSSCSWVITPGYAPVRLAFSRLDVERGFDYVRVYNAPYASPSALLANFTGWYGGSDLPVVQTADDGQNQPYSYSHSMLVVFSTDHSVAASGFEASYSQAFCHTLVEPPSGTFTDGSPPSLPYKPHTNCSWLIRPGYSPIVLTFKGYRLGDDKVRIYQGTNSAGILLAELTASGGTSTFRTDGDNYNSDAMLVHFESGSNPLGTGFGASYEQGDVYCSDLTVLTAEGATFSDGSPRYSYYYSRVNCQWLIQPGYAPGTPITLTFNRFDTESCCDVVKVYDGEDARSDDSNLLATLNGKMSANERWVVTTTSNAAGWMSGSHSMLVVFSTDESVQETGFSADYRRASPLDRPLYCSGDGLIDFTSPTGTFTDGSPPDAIHEVDSCAWRISPPYSNIELNVTRLDLSSSDDFWLFEAPSSYEAMELLVNCLETMRYYRSNDVESARSYMAATGISLLDVVYGNSSQSTSARVVRTQRTGTSLVLIMESRPYYDSSMAPGSVDYHMGTGFSATYSHYSHVSNDSEEQTSSGSPVPLIAGIVASVVGAVISAALLVYWKKHQVRKLVAEGGAEDDTNKSEDLPNPYICWR